MDATEELKVAEFSQEHMGQLNTYVSWYKRNMMIAGDNPPVGILLCTRKDHAMAKYALEGLSNTVLAAEYRTTLPQEHLLAEEIARTRYQLDARRQDAFRPVSRTSRTRPSRSRRPSGRATA